MTTWLRRLRGVLGIGATWAAFWIAIMMVIGAVIAIVDPDSIDPGEGPLRVSAIIGSVGFFSGVCFGVLLSIAERRKAILDLSMLRVAVWGTLGAAVLPLLTAINESVLTATIPLGILSATASLAVARRAERHILGDAGMPPALDPGAQSQYP